MIALRKHRPELSDPRLDTLAVDVDADARTLVLHRGALRVVVNLGGQPATVAVDGPPTEVLLASGDATTTRDTVQLAGESFAVEEQGPPMAIRRPATALAEAKPDQERVWRARTAPQLSRR